MRAAIATTLAACLFCVSPLASAQDRPAASATAPAIEPVLDHVPAGATAFLAVPDIGAVTGKVDKFLAEIGQAQAPANGRPHGLLPLLRERCLLGSGFDPRGGLAIVWPDANQFPLDLPGLTADRTPATAPGAEEPLPFVIFVPGKGVPEVFPGLATTVEGPYVRISFPLASMLACQAGGYVALSPSAKALASVLNAARKYPDQAGDDELKLVRGEDFILHVDTKLARPTLDRMMRQLEAELNEDLADPLLFLVCPWSLPIAWVGPQMPFYRQALGEMDSLTVGARLETDGIVTDFLAQWNPQSLFAKCAGPREATRLIDRLPDQKPLLAIWSAPPRTEAGDALEAQRIEAILSNINLQKLPARLHEDVKKLHRELADQVQGWEFVLGGGPPEGGLFSAALAIHCQDSQRTKALLVEASGLVAEMANTIGRTDDDQKYVLKHAPACETVAGLPVDAIELSTPAMSAGEEYPWAVLQKAFGEDKVRFLLAAPEPNELLVTLGGSKAFMARALDAAARGASPTGDATRRGGVSQCPATAKALQYLPPHCTTLAVFNASNALDVILGATHAFAASLPARPSPVRCTVPLAYGSGAAGTRQHAALFVPTQLIREIAHYWEAPKADTTQP